jgi:hypothetical protein
MPPLDLRRSGGDHVGVEPVELDERLSVEPGNLERRHHQALVREAIEVLAGAPYVDDAKPALREPRRVRDRALGGSSS